MGNMASAGSGTVEEAKLLPALEDDGSARVSYTTISYVCLVPSLAVLRVTMQPDTSRSRLFRHLQVTFGGGCFWCLEAIMSKTPGVLEATSG